MSHHIAHEPHRIPHKPKEKGAAHNAVHHERRHKTTEATKGFIGAGCTVTNITYQTNPSPSNYYPGIVTDGSGLRAYNSGGVITMQINAADGSVTVNGTGVITGGTIQTSATNPRVVMDGTGIRAYNAGGTQTFNLSGSDGSLTVSGTGIITGATIQTSSTNPRVVMDVNGFRAYSSLGQTVNVGSDGSFSLTTANASITASTTGVTISSGASTATGARVVVDPTGIKGYSSSGQTMQLGTDGSFSLATINASITASTSGVTISSGASTATGARVIIDPTGIKGYNASNVQEFLLDSTSGLISATGVIQSQPGSTVPWQTTGFYVGGGNLLPNASAEDPSTTQQILYLNPSAVTVNIVEVNSNGTRNGSSGFEEDTAGWGTTASYRIVTGATLTRTNAQAHSGSYSLQVVTTATANEGADFTNISVTSGQTYIASVWVKGNTGGESVQLFFGDGTVGHAAAGLTCTTSWQRITQALTPTATGTTGVAVLSAAAAAITFFVDDVQVETGSTATTYSASRFQLQYGSNTASSFIYANSTSAQVQAALNAAGVLPVGITPSVSLGPLISAAITITLSGSPTPVPTVLSVVNSSLAGGTAVVGSAPSGGWTTSWPYGWPYMDAVESISYASAFHGGNVFRLTATAAGTAYVGPNPPLSFGWTPGTTKYTLSAYFRAPIASRNVALTVNWYAANGVSVNQTISPTSSWTTRSDQWQRFTYTFTVPPATTLQSITLTGSPTGGSFTVSYGGVTSGAINWNSTAAQVQTALTAMSSIGANGVTVTGGPLPGSPVYVKFANPFSTAPTSLALGTNSLSGGTAPNAVFANSPASSMVPYATVTNPAAGEVFYIDAIQLETGDVATAFSPKPDEIIANTVTANMVNVGQLSAISANLGTITAGTVTGATLQTSVSGPRVVISGASNAFTVYDNTGRRMSIDGSNGLIFSTPNNVIDTLGSIEWYQGDPSSGGNLGAAISSVPGLPGTTSYLWIGSGSVLPGTLPAASDTTSNIQFQNRSGSSYDLSNAIYAKVWNGARTVSYPITLIDGTGSSSFLQKANNFSDIANISNARENIGIKCGTATVTWPGGTGFANGSFAHGLGRTPVWAGFTPLNQFGGDWNVLLTGLNATTVSFQANSGTQITAARTDTVYWAVIG